ncbi:hypothetical protein Fluta_0727 [Fluviicola taffensis DSM 16823]|uniref:Uncharacterized protein n=1 Tax=Fluviicola taffensis (strain DSM 16823 / NCIMB 13979 / RW262) TaxID=755732 RepID=F2II31_FLUTR|nr:hypothetical protein Fluta_0727 [Fluviicola taffensis DSM 16823]
MFKKYQFEAKILVYSLRFPHLIKFTYSTCIENEWGREIVKQYLAKFSHPLIQVPVLGEIIVYGWFTN